MKVLNNSLQKSAFTLAEVLVTLGIIGVVSAMTLPTLTKNHQRKVYVTQLHKVYNEFQQVTESAIAERNAINLREAGVSGYQDLDRLLKNHMKIVKTCNPGGGGAMDSCVGGSGTKNLSNASAPYSTGTTCHVTASGAGICYYSVAFASTGDFLTYVTFDTNGKSGPNILGRDVFVLGLFNDGSLGAYTDITCGKDDEVCENDKAEAESKADLARCQVANSSLMGADAAACFKVLQDNGWEMNY